MDQNDASIKVLEESQNTEFPYLFDTGFGFDIEVDENVFSPKHFNGWRIYTGFFKENKESIAGKSVLEIGCGTGITSLYLARIGAKKVTAVDINPFAVYNTLRNAKLNGIELDVRLSDIYSNIRQGEMFDIIYWNMPFMYRDESYEYDSVLEKGLFDPGYRITDRFLKESKEHLTPDGVLYVGMGGENFGDPRRFLELIKKHGYRYRILHAEQSDEINPVDFLLYELRCG